MAFDGFRCFPKVLGVGSQSGFLWFSVFSHPVFASILDGFNLFSVQSDFPWLSIVFDCFRSGFQSGFRFGFRWFSVWFSVGGSAVFYSSLCGFRSGFLWLSWFSIVFDGFRSGFRFAVRWLSMVFD